ncbi:MAG: glycerophosphodiester phosphodiesterase [Rhodococcus sp. (in: high G+C Gram-positive bacteria)]
MAVEQVTVIGHRGASSEAPENTMRSFVRSLELGANGFEFDVQLTSDGAPVVIHDAMLDRTTTGSGPVLAATRDQVVQPELRRRTSAAARRRAWSGCRGIRTRDQDVGPGSA